MAADGRSPEAIRRDIEAEREQLAGAIDAVRANLRAKLPVIATGALAAGFVFAGGIGATMRLLARRRG